MEKEPTHICIKSDLYSVIKQKREYVCQERSTNSPAQRPLDRAIID
jgi:hypothetical protein